MVLLQPANFKTVVDGILNTPLGDIAGALRGFQWTYDKVSPWPVACSLSYRKTR
jgi:hypothetical protein